MAQTINVKADPVRVRLGMTTRLTPDMSSTGAGPFLALWTSDGRGAFERAGKSPIQTVEGEVHGESIEIAAAYIDNTTPSIRWAASGMGPGTVTIGVELYALKTGLASAAAIKAVLPSYLDPSVEPDFVGSRTIEVTDPSRQVEVTMRPAYRAPDPLQALHTTIRATTSALSFDRYAKFMDSILCIGGIDDARIEGRWRSSSRRIRLPFPDTDAYRQLKVATEVFLMLNTGADVTARGGALAGIDTDAELAAESRRYNRTLQDASEIFDAWDELMTEGESVSLDGTRSLLYLALVRNKLRGVDSVAGQRNSRFAGSKDPDDLVMACQQILQEKLTYPTFLELIWSYWHEEAMLVQTMNAITWRFQNRRAGDRDPLSLIEIDPLRPLNNFIWGYIQDEQHRLTLVRRAYEYDHHYGLTLMGKAVPPVRGADSRTRFIEAFHHLLFLCAIFFKEEDDTTVVADGFPILNALKEVHLLLTQGAHNQYGDLPWTARQEMLMQQWLLARPEFREFLPRRIMVDYPEEWMDSVETMKTLQGWRTASVLHFRDLGVFGEQILLGIRFGAWPSEIESLVAANWARYWRPEIQGYIHAYRAATGVDLTERVDATPPSLLLQQRLQAQLPAGRGRPVSRPVARPVTRAALPWGPGDR